MRRGSSHGGGAKPRTTFLDADPKNPDLKIPLLDPRLFLMIACMKWFAMVHQLGAPSCPLVLMGVIGDPVMTRWRTLMRLQILKMMDLVEGVQFDVRFVVAKMDHCPRSTLETLGCNSTSGPPLETCAALQRENEEHRDIVQLRFARDCGSRSGQAVAEKTYEWYAHAAQHGGAAWVGKFDDDSLPNLMHLGRDVLRMQAAALSVPPPLFAY